MDGGASAGPHETAAAGGVVRVRAALAGIREPIVLVLLLIAFFTSISGKPLDGLLMLLAGAGLAWDAGHRAFERMAVTVPAGQTGEDIVGPTAPAGREEDGLARNGGLSRAASASVRPRPAALVVIAAITASAAYAVIVGSFGRYSWPATVAVVGLGVGAVLLGWHGPLRRRPDPGKLPRGGALAWGGVLVAGSLWELWALLHQPSLTTSSYDHPTISTLTDPVLATMPGRAGVLALWLALGWYLVRR